MRKRLLAWLLCQIRAEIEALVVTEATRLVAEMRIQLAQELATRQAEAQRAAQAPPRRFIGQS